MSNNLPHLDGDKVIQALQYLQREGFTVERLQQVHHTERDASFEASIAWRIENQGPDYRQGNPAFHERLLFIAAERWRTARDFDELVDEALLLFPKIPR